MCRKFYQYTFSIALILLCSCVAHRSAEAQDERVSDAYDKLLKQATRYVFQLKEQNQLPGVAKADHGNLEVRSEGLTDAQGHFLKKDVIFPLTFTTYLTVSGKETDYQYKVTKDNQHVSWRLDGAWKKEKNESWTEVK